MGQSQNEFKKNINLSLKTNLVGGFNPSVKYQLVLLFPIYGKIKKNVPNHQTYIDGFVIKNHFNLCVHGYLNDLTATSMIQDVPSIQKMELS